MKFFFSGHKRSDSLVSYNPKPTVQKSANMTIAMETRKRKNDIPEVVDVEEIEPQPHCSSRPPPAKRAHHHVRPVTFDRQNPEFILDDGIEVQIIQNEEKIPEQVQNDKNIPEQVQNDENIAPNNQIVHHESEIEMPVYTQAQNGQIIATGSSSDDLRSMLRREQQIHVAKVRESLERLELDKQRMKILEKLAEAEAAKKQ